MENTKEMNVKDLSAATSAYLKSLGYGPYTLQRMGTMWRALGKFVDWSPDPYEPIQGFDYDKWFYDHTMAVLIIVSPGMMHGLPVRLRAQEDRRKKCATASWRTLVYCILPCWII